MMQIKNDGTAIIEKIFFPLGNCSMYDLNINKILRAKAIPNLVFMSDLKASHAVFIQFTPFTSKIIIKKPGKNYQTLR